MKRTPHPYDFSVMEEGNAFIFNTKGNKHISVFFSEFEWEEVQSPVFQISIDNREGTSEYDARIQDTIVCIIDYFMIMHNRVLIYYCYFDDGRENKRNSHFLYWYKNTTRHEEIELITDSITQEMPQEDGVDIERTIYAGALFFKSNPNAEQVKANFHSLLQLYAK